MKKITKMAHSIHEIMKSGKKLMIRALSFANVFVPKKTAVLFYNEAIRDNNKYLMEYMAENTELPLYCFYESGSEDLRIKGKRIKYVRGVIQLLYGMLTCRIVIVSFDLRYRIKPARNQRIIQLWHGYALKTIGTDSELKRTERRAYYYTDILCYSDYWRDNLLRTFGATKEQLHLWDNPRNDLLYCPAAKDTVKKIVGRDYYKMILWMPTYRRSHKLRDSVDSPKDIPIIDRNNIAQINECLIRTNNILVIKTHPLQNSIKELAVGITNIIVLENEEIEEHHCELYQFLAAADALITDYSSVYFDYLKLNKPIGFAYDDYDEYRSKRGFMFDRIEDLMPGPRLMDTASLCTFLRNPFFCEELYESERKRIRCLMSKWDDDENCKRVSDFIESIMVKENE